MRADGVVRVNTSRARGAARACAFVLFAVCALVGLLNVPAAFTQNQTGPRRGSGANPAGPTRQPPAQTYDPAAKPGQQAEEQVDEDEVVRINASEVLLPVTVRDASGALVKGLGRGDFKIFEDGREQPLSDLSLR